MKPSFPVTEDILLLATKAWVFGSINDVASANAMQEFTRHKIKFVPDILMYNNFKGEKISVSYLCKTDTNKIAGLYFI